MDPNKVLMIPNAVDTTKFYPMDKNTVRERLGLPRDVMIVIFVGHFINRKGPDRLLKAMELLPSDYRCVFIGEGEIKLAGPRVLFCGRVPNDKLNEWLNAANVFCLPTLAEGSCNAIEEARAVGLPIVTSNIPDITDFNSSADYVLVDPMSVLEIKSGIEQAVSRTSGSIMQPSLDNSKRAITILNWIKSIAGRIQK
jgi:glycosyltransferase involved in cell wall biosynthesis